MSAFGVSSSSATTTGNASIGPTDCQVPQAGSDGTSSLSWSPTSNLLVASSWDGHVRCWEVAEQGGRIQANPKAQGKTRVLVFAVFPNFPVKVISSTFYVCRTFRTILAVVPIVCMILETTFLSFRSHTHRFKFRLQLFLRCYSQS